MAIKTGTEQARKSSRDAKPRKVRRPERRPPLEPNKQRWIINFRLLGITAGVVVVVLAVLYFWGRYQVQQQADALLVLAENQSNDGKDAEALASYRRYLTLSPDDAQAYADYAELYASKKESPAHVKIQRCEEAIAKLLNDPEAKKIHIAQRINEMRYLAGDLLFQRGQATRGPGHLNKALGILELCHQTPEVLALTARCDLKKREFDPQKSDPEELYKRVKVAYEADSANAEMCLELARFKRDGLNSDAASWTQEKRKANAESLLIQLTMNHAQNPFAWLARFMFYMDSENRIQAKPCIDKAIELIEGSTSDRAFVVFSRAGLFAVAEDDVNRAMEYFQKSIDVAPSTIDAVQSVDDRLILSQSYTNHAALQYREGQIEDAIATLNAAREMLEGMDFQPEMILVDIFTETGRFKEAWAPLDRLKSRYGNNAEMNAYLMETRDLDEIAAVLLRLEARLLQAEGRYYDAIEAWDRYVIALGPSIQTHDVAKRRMEAHLSASDCYVVLQDFDKARQQIDRAGEAMRNNSRVDYYRGNLDERQGKISAAMRHYALALTRDPVYYPAREGYARVVFSLTKASGQQPDWDQFESQFPDMQALPQEEREKWTLFRAQAAISQRDYDRAGKILREAQKQFANSPRIIEALARNAATAGNNQQADAYAQQLEEKSPERFHALNFDLHARRGNDEQAEAELLKAIELSDGDRQLALEQMLAEFELTRLGKPEQGRARLASVVARSPLANLALNRRLVELAIVEDAIEEAKEHLANVEEFEGADGVTVAYLRARIALQTGDIAAAKRGLESLRGMRTRWSPVKLLEALIAEEEDRMADAVLAYQDAVRFGERNPAVASRIYELLSELNRYADAEKFLSKISPESREIGLFTSLRSREFSQAVRYAEAALDTDRENLSSWLRYGSALVFADRLDDAEEAFKSGLALEPTNPQALMQLVGCRITIYRKSGEDEDLKRAQESLEQFLRDAETAPETLSFLAAQCHQLLGEFDEAETHYRRALRINGNKDMTMIRTAAPFFASRDRAFAIELLKEANRREPDANDITRLLAVLYSEAGTLDDWERAWKLLAEESGEQGHLDDRRLLALMMLRRGNKDSQYEAAKIMEAVIAESTQKSPKDQRLLAEIHEKMGDLDVALAKMRDILNEPEPSLDARQYFVQLLIKAENFVEAETELTKMQEDASVPRGFLLHALCDIAQARGQQGKIDDIINDFIQPEIEKQQDNAPLQGQMMLVAADLSESFDRHAAAEIWHKKRLKLSSRTFTTYAIWLARQQRTSEAVDLALAHAKPQDVTSMIGLLTTLTVAGAPAAEMARAKSVLDQATRMSGDEVDFLIALATLRQIQRKPREAVVLYERALRRSNQSSITALNNLALLLSEMEGRGEEALRHINKAINARGTDNEALLDTKASVLISLGRYGDALAIMQRIVLRKDGNPVYYLHLAECQLQMGDREAARRSLESAEENKVDQSVLTANDARLLQKLRTELQITLKQAPQESVQ
ncbi:MAG: tetratricopeptide repeat protein [Pirellulales bacterium]|nr:tetratricopeptide repeat protein [Pirellulales bacterium]